MQNILSPNAHTPNTLNFSQYSLSFAHLISIIVAAAMVTFALFVGMHHLISNDQITREKPILRPVIDLHHNFEDKPIIEKKTLKPKPKPIPQPKQLTKIEPSVPKESWNNNLINNTFSGPIVEKSSAPTFTLAGGEARPIVRIEPKYPVAAARDGIEGWVRLTFSVSATGEVENIQVIDAKPKRVFNQAAKRALARWKYKPNIVAGKSQAQDGMMVMLDFKLAS